MNIQSILDEYDIEYKEFSQHKNIRFGWLGLDCPFCGQGSGKYIFMQSGNKND